MAIIEGIPTKDKRKYSFKIYYNDLEGNRKQYLSKKYALKSEAKEAERLFLLNLTNKIDNRNITFKDLFNDYKNYIKTRVKITTWTNEEKFYKYFKDLGNIKFNDFKIQHFNLWKQKIDSKLSTTYKNNIYKKLRAIINYGERTYNINLLDVKNKMTNFTDPNELQKEMLFFTYDEFLQFIEQEKELKYRCYFETLYYCGLRKGEANALNWNDIDFNKETLNISKNLSLKIKGQKYVILPPKTKSSIRILPLPKILLNDLKNLYNEYKKYKNFDKSWFIFGGIYPLADTTTENKKHSNCINAGIKKEIRIHDFRHSCASLLINNGANPSLVSKYLGHSKTSTTLDTYSHMFPNNLDDIINKIDKITKK